MVKLFQNKTSAAMWLFAGLGNSGGKYVCNRHNIGFMVVDAIAARHDFPPFRSKFQGALSEGRIGGEKVVLLKPQTMMNLSGQSIQKTAEFYKIEPGRIVIFHDELDLESAKVRVKEGGGVAGHNGLKSIKSCLGTADFKRVRLGIGHPGDKNQVSNYVLNDFSKAEKVWVEKLLPALADHVELLLEGNESDFMTRVAEEIK